MLSKIGRPGRFYDGSLRVPAFYDVHPSSNQPERHKLLTVCGVEGTNLFVTRFRSDYLSKDQTVTPSDRSEWWTALGQTAHCIVVDAPSLAENDNALVVAPRMDAVILVVRADRTSAKAVAKAKRKLERAGAPLLGALMNCVKSDGLRSGWK